MAKIFKDFKFYGKLFSQLSAKYVSVDFDENSEINLSLDRDMVTGEANRYRTEKNYFYDNWTDTLDIELDIVKDYCKCESQNDMEISKEEIREITKWLTSSHFPEWINFEYDESDNNDVKNYYGWFKNVETFTHSGTVYGLRLHFKCTTPFGYTDEIVKEKAVTTKDNILITNNSDELCSVIYPKIEITPNENGQVYICNLSDCKILETGILSSPTENYFDAMLDAIEKYAKSNGYTIEYAGTGAYNIVPICNDTAVQFSITDKYGNDTKCTAYYLEDTKQYSIITGGFMYMTVYKDLKVYMDCSLLTINDELGRMITYDKLGISNVDHMYWVKLLSGNNSILLYGNAKFTFKYVESRKVGE